MSGDSPKPRGGEAPLEEEKKPGGPNHEETKENNKRESPTEEQPTAADSHGSQDTKKMTFASIWSELTPAEPVVNEFKLGEEEYDNLKPVDGKVDKVQQDTFRIWFQYKTVRQSEKKPYIKWAPFSNDFAKKHLEEKVKIEKFEYCLNKTAKELFVDPPGPLGSPEAPL